MHRYIGKIWVNGACPVTMFLAADSKQAAEARVRQHAEYLTRGPAPGVDVQTRITVEDDPTKGKGALIPGKEY